MTTARDLFVQSLLEEGLHCHRCMGSGYRCFMPDPFGERAYLELSCSCRDGLNAEGQDRLDEWSRPSLPLEGSS